MLTDAQKDPLKISQVPEPETPKGPKCTQHTSFAIPSGSAPAMDINNPEFNAAQVNTQDRATKFLNQGLNLIAQLHKVMLDAAQTQGDTPKQLINAIATSFNLKEVHPAETTQPVTGVNPNQPAQQIPQGTQNTTASLTLHAPQPTRPIDIRMPPTRPSRPSTAAQGCTPYSPGKGKGRQCSKTPPSSKEGSPRPSSCSYASKAALSNKDTLAHVQDIISKAPSLLIDDTMAIAKTLPFTPAPKPNSRKSATIQGSKESSCIILTLTLLHQGLVECIQDLVLEDHQLAMLATHTIAISNDRRSIILRLNQPLSEDNTHAFCALVATATNTPFEECLITNRPTYSTAKIEFLPINKSITVERIHDALLTIPVYRDHHTINSVQLLPHPMNPLVQTTLVKFFDYHNGSLLKRLCWEMITIGTDSRRIKPWVNKPMA
ncbi:hypothetical protein AX15_006081 [Amanita polypyramis BW_CC]|nr:hypothetical protein AX15_006081 [Amanita polypyramis BW_CC]